MAERRATHDRDEPEPPSVQVAVGGQKSIESAPLDAHIPDALGNNPQPEPVNRLADKTVVKEFEGGVTAAATPVKGTDLGPFGMVLPASGELHGGSIEKVLEPPPDTQVTSHPLTKERAAMMTPVYQKLAALVNRPPSEWGLLGPGETIRGHMLLLDLHTGEKVRGMDGHRIGEGELYANLRQLPESLATGDTIDKVLGGSK